MSRKARPQTDRVSVGAAPSPIRLSSGVVGQSGSRNALAELNAAIAEIREFAIQPMLQRAMQALEADDYRTGGEWALKALNKDERSGPAWYLLAVARERAGDFVSSVQAYEAALKLLPDHHEVANDLGRLAYRMGMTTQAEKLFRLFLERNPDSPEGANNLSCAIRDQDRANEAIDILRPAIMKTPGNAMLWNSMGTLVADQGDFPTAQVFFHEALRLDARFPKAQYNLANTLLSQGDAQAALVACDAALEIAVAEDDRQMMMLARSTMLMALGRIGEGWDQYEARLHSQFNGGTAFAVDRPRWAPGDALEGRSLLVVGEQGLGDEILFANTLPDVLDRLGPDGRLTLAVEPRLVTLYQRRFPQITVGAHATYAHAGRTVRVIPFLTDATEIDLWTPIASLLREFRRSVADFPRLERQLVADPDRVAHWRGVLAEVSDLPKVGLLWKSAIQKDNRSRYYSPFATWEPVLRQPGVTFVNLQYGDCSDELEYARREMGAEIWTPPGIDLKQDLDDIAALSTAVDLVAGFSNATLNIAAACGVPTFLISTPGAWTRLGTETYPWYPQARVFLPPAFADWDPVMAQVAEAIGAFAAER